jgi:hypothetical protein
MIIHKFYLTMRTDFESIRHLHYGEAYFQITHRREIKKKEV